MLNPVAILIIIVTCTLGSAYYCFPVNHATTTFSMHNYEVTAPVNLINGHADRVVLVTSRRDNFKNRALIRQTWGSEAELLIFCVASFSLEEDERLAVEYRLHKDIIIMHTPDDYRLTTDKLIVGLGSIRHLHIGFERLLRTDDDVYVDLPQLWQEANGDYWGHCLMGAKLERNPASEFYTSYENEPEDNIPTIISGSTINLTYWSFNKLLDYLLIHNGFWNDDNVVAYAMDRMNITPICATNLCVHGCEGNFEAPLVHHLTPQQMLIQRQVRIDQQTVKIQL